MSDFIIKKLLWGIPTLLVIFLLCFLLLDHDPEKTVSTYMSNHYEGIKVLENVEEYERYYIQTVKKLGLDKPAFYISITSKEYPDTLNKIYFLPQKSLAIKLINRTGNWPVVKQYFDTIDRGLNLCLHTDRNKFSGRENLKQTLFTSKYDVSTSEELLNYQKDSAIGIELKNTLQSLMVQQKSFEKVSPKLSLLMPAIKWNGIDCRFHRLFADYFSNKQNISLIDSRPVWAKIKESLKFTLSINLLAILISTFISIRLGLFLSLNQGRKVADFIGSIMFVLYTMPAFWVGSLLLVFFTSSSYGSFLNLFPVGGVGDISVSNNFFEIIAIRFYHFILPIICLSYPVIVFLTTHLRDSMMEVSKSQFRITALAKGLTPKVVLRNHVLKNAIFPFITLLGNIIPSLFAGSVIIEVLFNIPGMGRLAYQSIISRDWPVLFNIILLTGSITIISQILVDIIYSWLDPRIKLNK